MFDFDTKEKYLLSAFKSKFEQNEFDELDVLSFLIFIRDHLKNGKYNYISDLGDTVAHRHRNRGIAVTAITAAIDNNYQLETNSKAVKGYRGIAFDAWEKEWISLGSDISITFSDATIHELSICILSLLQFSEYEKDGNRGTIRLLHTDNGALNACTTEGKSHSKYNFYFVLENAGSLDKTSCEISEPVFAVREDGKLRLKTAQGQYLI